MEKLSIGWIQLARSYRYGKAWSIDRTFGSKDALCYAHHWTVLDIPIKTFNLIIEIIIIIMIIIAAHEVHVLGIFTIWIDEYNLAYFMKKDMYMMYMGSKS